MNFICFRRLKNLLQEDVLRSCLGDASVTTELEEEFKQMEKDREVLRSIFPMGDSKVLFSVFDLAHFCPILIPVVSYNATS